jgi:hypothetical protein
MVSLRPSDRVSYAMVCVIGIATLGGVILTSAQRRIMQQQARPPPSLESTAMEDRLKIFDKK